MLLDIGGYGYLALFAVFALMSFDVFQELY